MIDSVRKTPEERLSELASTLKEAYESKGCSLLQGHGEVTLVVPREHLLEIATELRDADHFRFEELIDLCGIDYAAYGQTEWDTDAASSTGFGRGVERAVEIPEGHTNRFAVVYHLLSVTHNIRLRLRVFADSRQPIVPSVMCVWHCADWFEREAFDLYGILFDGHPDLRRILTDYGFVGHPFRKDFPLSGHVEMRYDPEQKRLVYEPVSIEPRTLVPRVIRDDNRYLRKKTG